MSPDRLEEDGVGQSSNILVGGILFFLIFKNFIYLGCAEFCCCAGFSLVVGSGGHSLVAVCRLLTVASLVEKHGL